MGMRDIIKNAVKAGMKGIGDIKANITYRVETEGAKDDRGVPVSTFVDHTIEATIVNYSNKEEFKDGGLIAPGDRMAIIENRFFEALSIVPKKSDQIQAGGDTFKETNPRIDPSGNVYFFELRQVS